MNKDLIAKRFCKNLSTYNENARIQKQMAEKLLSNIEQKYYCDILEIGCGTGLLTQCISQKLEFDNYIANDIIEDCKNFIKEINPEIVFISGDIEEIIQKQNKKFDLIISNASFQWIENLEHFVANLIKILKPNGMILFSTFGRENFREIFQISGKTLKYYSKNELLNMFKCFNPKIEEEIRILSFATPIDVLKHIKHTGANCLESMHWTRKDLIKFENEYNNFCSGHPTLTYNPVYIKIFNEV